ncbi:MAG: nucleotide exchange factor GrpE [Candidatus Pacebacteria bacterium]|nr:nucleotide exchange factor GrpE [Candidatus Paceibacterota bacterium]
METQNNKENTPTELEECQKIRDEYLAGWQRCRADFLNYKKEESQRAAELINFAKTNWALEILLVIDNFERAMQHKPGPEICLEWVKGVELIEGQLKEFLKSEGVEEIKAMGEEFNPEFHEAIGETENSTRDSGIVAEVLEKGYTINGKLLRPAKVKVAK